MRYLRISPVLTAALVGALAGCTEPRDSGPSLTVSLQVQHSTAPDVRLDVAIEGKSVTLISSSNLAPPVAVLQLAPMVNAPMTFVVRTSAGDTLARVSGAQDLLSGYTYGATAIVGPTRPVSICGQVVGAALLPGTSSDTLFILFGGLPKGAIC